MADFRQIHTRIWKDDWFSELEPDAKLLFIYLFSNEQAEVAGVYELPVKYMAFEVGLSQERIQELLLQFEQAQKVYYRNKWVWVVNLRKYNETKSPKVINRIAKDLESLPDGELKKLYCDYNGIPYRYPIDTVSIPEYKWEQGMDTQFQNDSETETETETEKKQKPASSAYIPSSNEERIYRAVTNHPTIPGDDIDQVCHKIAAIQREKGFTENQTVDYLRPFWLEKKRRYPANVDCFWLDWAVAGVIPLPGKNGAGYQNPRVRQDD